MFYIIPPNVNQHGPGHSLNVVNQGFVSPHYMYCSKLGSYRISNSSSSCSRNQDMQNTGLRFSVCVTTVLFGVQATQCNRLCKECCSRRGSIRTGKMLAFFGANALWCTSSYFSVF